MRNSNLFTYVNKFVIYVYHIGVREKGDAHELVAEKVSCPISLTHHSYRSCGWWRARPCDLQGEYETSQFFA